jgi:phage-related baseplate assembly protein
MELYSAAAQIYQAMQYIDRAGKQNLLKYSYSDYLDHLAAFKGLTREPEAAATTTVRFTLSAKREAATGIPVGTRVAVPDWSVYFATTQYMEIPAGSMTVDVPASCTVTGTVGNGLDVGELSKLVDPIPYMASVSNITATAGGAEIESDDNLAERIYLFPGSYSTAGPEANYEYHAKKYNVNVGNVVVESDQAAGTVDIYFLMADGTAPPEEMITGLQNYLRDNNIRPMTDLVRVAAPEEVEYSINLTYYINRSDSNRAVAIQQAVDAAVTSYTTWQRAIGRDINPSKLGALIMAAGAKRVELTAPVHQTVGKKAVATLTGKTVQYGGLEDD